MLNLTEFKNVKCEICQRQIEKLQAIRVRSQAYQLDRKSQIDAAFFERLKENHKKTYIEALKKSCVKLNSVWNFIIHLICKLTGYTISMMTSNFCLFFDFLFLNISHWEKQINAIVFLSSNTKQ